MKRAAAIAAFILIFFSNLKPVMAEEAPPLAVEAIHYTAADGHARNVNGFYQPAKKHFVPSTFNRFLNFNHSITVANAESAAGTVTVRYFPGGGDGAVVSKTYNLPGNGFIVAGSDAGLPSTFSGSAVVESTVNTVAEVAIANNANFMRGYRATPDTTVSTRLFVPIAYDRVFQSWGKGFSTGLNLQNAGSITIQQGAVKIKLTCRAGNHTYNLTNNSAIMPNHAVFIPLKIDKPFINNAGLCDDSGSIDSVFFGHGEVDSPVPVVGVVTISHFNADGSLAGEREEELSGSLSKTLYVPSVITGTWWGGYNAGYSLNISNPNLTPANVFVDVYRKMGSTYQFVEHRRPQGPDVPEIKCNGSITDPIAVNGEKSFMTNKDPNSDLCANGITWGTGDDAFGFNIVTSDQPITLSYNKSNSSGPALQGVDDFAELGLRAEDVKPTVYIPQVFVNFFPQFGTFNTRVNVLNPSDRSYTYRFEYFNPQGNSVLAENHTIGGKQVFVDNTQSKLAGGQAYFLKISPACNSSEWSGWNPPGCPACGDNNVVQTRTNTCGQSETNSCNTPLCAVPGDVSGDRRVTIDDLRQVAVQGSISSYNSVVANYGK